MGLFDRFLGGDPERELTKARRQLDAGRPDKALTMARKLAGRLDGEALAAAETLVDEAREALLNNALEMARHAEESEFWEDAIDWLDRALEQADDGRRAEIETRRRAAESRIEAEETVDEAPRYRTIADQAAEDDEDAFDGGGFDDTGFDAWLHMLDDEIAAGYRQHLDVLRSSYSALVEERISDALESLDTLAEQYPDDAIVRFERGRARLMADEPAGAAEDLDQAWKQLGDAPLDRAGALSVPALWGEASLLAGAHDAVVDRLADLGNPATGRQDCHLPWARALVATEAFDDAEAVLTRGMRRFKSPEIPHLLAQILTRSERRDEAIEVLEMAIAPSCATGNCAKPPAHVPSFRALAVLHLSRGDEADLERIADLLGHIERAQQGLAAEDLLIAAELYRRNGDDEAAAEATAHAETLRDVVVRERVAAQPTGPSQRIL
ncbi:MAG: hypothetical protein AAGE94_09475 [Acidobacteriota bacterium]